jgi:hypothetical protein
MATPDAPAAAPSLTQHSADIPFEIFTAGGLFTEEELARLRAFVESAPPDVRTITPSPFRNGKLLLREVSALFWERLRPLLPERYVDRVGVQWRFVGVSRYIMFASFRPGDAFGVHTDTGSEWDDATRRYSKHTVLLYLNHDFQGGRTLFFDDRFAPTCTVTPHCGGLLAFDIDLCHIGELVSVASKLWIGTELVCERLTA